MLHKFKDLDLYTVNAPADYDKLDHEAKNAGKYFCTFPYPYMNGYLHLGKFYDVFIYVGHAYTLAKAEF